MGDWNSEDVRSFAATLIIDRVGIQHY